MKFGESKFDCKHFFGFLGLDKRKDKLQMKPAERREQCDNLAICPVIRQAVEKLCVALDEDMDNLLGFCRVRRLIRLVLCDIVILVIRKVHRAISLSR